MIFAVILVFFVLAGVILIFSYKKFSPIPYFPAQKIDIPIIVKSLNLRNNQTIIDLGAGDGIVIFKSAKQAYLKKLNTKFVAVEINPLLIIVLHLRRLFHPNKKNIKVVRADIFKLNLHKMSFWQSRRNVGSVQNRSSKQRLQTSRNDNEITKQFNNLTIYLYISPWFLEKVMLNIKNQIAKFSVVSYMYPIKSLKEKERKIQGKNTIFVYC